MANPLTGMGGKPVVGVEDSHKTFVGRVIIDLLEDSRIPSMATG